MTHANTKDLLVDALYDAACDPGGIGDVLRLLATYAGAFGAAFIVGRDLPNHPVERVYTWGFPEDAEQVYFDGFVAYDLPYLRVFRHPANQWFDTATFSSTEEIRENPYYQEFLPRIGTGAIAGIRIEAGTEERLLVSLHRRDPQDGFAPPDLAALDRLVPDLRRYVRLRRTTAQLRSQAEALRHAYDQMRDAIVIIGHDGRVLEANEAARGIFRENDGISVRRDRVTFIDGVSRHYFSTHLEKLLRDDTLRGAGATDVAVTRASGRQSYLMTLLPLPRGMGPDGWVSRPCAMAIIFDPDPPSRLSTGRLMNLFGLTPAEARLAYRLACGNSLQDISADLGVARSTLKSQLLATFAKTGTGRQSELVRLMMSLPASRIRMHSPE